MQGNDSMLSIVMSGRRVSGGSWVPGAPRRDAGRWRRLVTTLSAFALTVGGAVALPVIVATPAQAATTNTFTVKVASARTEVHSPVKAGGVAKGDPVKSYRFMINEDNSGTADPAGGPDRGSGCSADDPGYPNSCLWPSINQNPGAAPIVWQGTGDDFADGTKTLNLPDGKYLITVLADDYKIDGTHFTLPMDQDASVGGNGLVSVEVQPNPLPDSTLRAQVYLDESSTNGAIDNGEDGLAGFQGHINDVLGEVTTDVYGNPLCTKYAGEDANYQISWAVNPNAPSDGSDPYQYRNADGTPTNSATIGGK
jgi:hypothetical protein